MHASTRPIDLYDPGQYVGGVPHASFAWLRRHEPVFWQELPEGRGFWLLSKHADVMQASSDPHAFSAARGGIVIEDPDPQTLAMLRTQLLAMDPPEHGRMRRSVLAGLSPGRIARLEPWLRERTRDVFERALETRECDFVHALAGELPLQVICELLAVPAAERARIRALGDSIIGRDDAELAREGGASAASFELGAYGFELAKQRRGAGADDLISLLLNAEIDGHSVNEAEFAGLFVQLIVAGNETSRSLLSGGVLALVEHPQAWRALAEDPQRIPCAVEELLRWVTPVHYFRRTATRDQELRSVRIREGDRVVLHYTSANRDEDVFDEPDRFDVAREPNPHLSFGWGEHFCLGARLARLEACVFLEELFARVARIDVLAPPVRMRSNLNNSWKSIPVRLHAR